MPENPEVKASKPGGADEDRMAMYRELAKHTKPTGPSATGKSEEGADDEE